LSHEVKPKEMVTAEKIIAKKITRFILLVFYIFKLFQAGYP
jgi:hypothetical protein